MNNFDELKFHSNAIAFLGDKLQDGSLVLFLGAGASKGFGLPSWVELVNKLREEVGLQKLQNYSTADDLQHAADDVICKLGGAEVLLDKVEKYLYENIDDLDSVEIFENHLLVAISSLLMGSKRGHVTRVVTLNYDSMLEWFLSLFGFYVKSIYEIPTIEGNEDVRIYHPHGFIPHPQFNKSRSSFIILGMDATNERLGTPGHPWFEMVRHILDTGICLFIGMSPATLSDRAIAPLLKTSSNKRGGIQPLGVWILKDKIEQSKENEFDRLAIVPIVIEDAKKISQFVLQISQYAMKSIQ